MLSPYVYIIPRRWRKVKFWALKIDFVGKKFQGAKFGRVSTGEIPKPGGVRQRWTKFFFEIFYKNVVFMLDI